MNFNLNSFYNQIPAILVVMPMVVGALIILFSSERVSRVIFLITNIGLSAVSFYAIIRVNASKDYIFGDWPNNIGIELKYDIFSAYSTFLLFFIFTIFAISNFNILRKKVNSYIRSDRSHIIYSLMLFIECGLAGLILTNDIFNFYVFLEISALTTYPLMIIGSDKKRYIYAFEYLMIGTLAATVILLSIGFIFSQVGSLNLDEIKKFYASKPENLRAVISFLILGILTKLAIFPVQGWKINSYRSISSNILGFFIATSTIAFVCVLVKFNFLYQSDPKLINFIYMISALCMLFGSYFALQETDFIKIILLTSVTSAGIYLAIVPFVSQKQIFALMQLMVIDSLIKMSLVLVLPVLNKENFTIKYFNNLYAQSPAVCFIFSLLFLNAASLPPSIYFFNKITILQISFKECWPLSIAILISSLYNAMCYLRLIRQMIKYEEESEDIFKFNKTAIISVIFLTCCLFYLLFSSESISDVASLMYDMRK
jgi:multicomponent Na+:H+ antiporter subunit D